jgi:hypothetical protein
VIKNLNKKKQINFFKKNFIKIIRKVGFEIIDQNNFTIPTSNVSLNNNISVINKRNITLPLGEIKITRKIKSFLVIFRSFTNENSLLTQNKKRLFEKEKKEYSLRSLNSICINIKNVQKKMKNINFFLKIIDDNSKPEIIKLQKKIAIKNNILFEISNLNIDKYKDKMKFSNSKRMLAHNAHIYQSKEFALNSNYDLIYFLEDDYLHHHDAIEEMIFSYEKFSTIYKKDIIMCPADYPFLYNKLEQTNILTGYKKHWRRVNESLCTYLVSRNTLKVNWKIYKKMFLNNFNPYEKPLHSLYKKIECFSPIPSLALHMTNVNSAYGLSPMVDWLEVWKKNKY